MNEGIESGQVWVHKKTGRRIRVESVNRFWEDVGYTVEGTGRKGDIFIVNLLRNYELAHS